MNGLALNAATIASAIVLAGCGAAPETATPGPVEAAADGVGKVVKEEAAGRPFPREKLPDFVETHAGGSYLTSFFGSNEKRRTGTLVYRADAAAADLIAFHKASAEKSGFAVSLGEAQVVRDKRETAIEATHADGRVLNVVVIEESPESATVQINFIIPAA